MGWDKKAKQAAEQAQAAKQAAKDRQRSHSKRPDPVKAAWTSDNVCRSNGHKPCKG